MKIEIDKFDIKLNKEEVLRAAGCVPGSAVYDSAARYFDELLYDVENNIELYAAAQTEGMKAYCAVSAGEKISSFIRGLFDRGEAVKGLLADTMADAYIFEADKILSDRMKIEGAENGFGVKKRLYAPDDYPLSEQKIILEKLNTKRVTLTDAFMLSPVKSMAYVLELTEDKAVFNAQHDCSRCGVANCPMRQTLHTGKTNIVSDYSYTPHITDGSRVICADIGTTTVVLQLITKNGGGKTIKTINPQRRFGADVLSRIEAASRGRDKELASDILYTLRKGIDEVSDGAGADRLIIAGNTTMIHLLMGYPCNTLGVYPFKPYNINTVNTEIKNLPAVILGGISAFVGGDVVSGMYMCDFDKSEKIKLLVDLGTNGEIALGNKNKILTASAAAGPAFEGGQLSCGTGSIDGAVCGVTLNPTVIKTIGDKAPVGICGTGIIELLSEMRDNKIIDETGLLRKEYFEKGFSIADNIYVTQNDIRQVQTAKAAVRAGVEGLMRSYGADYDDIDTVYLAGGFGYALSAEKACNIGILPDALCGKIKAIGNGSLGGCAKFASETDGAERIKNIQQISDTLQLADNEDFKRMYIEYMGF